MPVLWIRERWPQSNGAGGRHRQHAGGTPVRPGQWSKRSALLADRRVLAGRAGGVAARSEMPEQVQPRRRLCQEQGQQRQQDNRGSAAPNQGERLDFSEHSSRRARRGNRPRAEPVIT